MSFPLFGEPRLPDDPALDPQEAAFLRAVLDDPDDDAPRLVFADWLDDNDRADKAAFVRLEVELSRLPRLSKRFREIRDELFRLDDLIGGQWSGALIRAGRLLNCGKAKRQSLPLRFAYECPNRWSDLEPLPKGNDRFCKNCRKTVHFCASKEEAEAHAVQGHCVAIGSRLDLAVRQKYAPPSQPAPAAPEEDEFMRLGDVLPPGVPDPLESPYYRWAEEFLSRPRKRWGQLGK
jgi:uncharacterized protein (TIGR02996 family)